MWSSTIQKGNSCPSTVRTPWAPYRPLPTSALFKAWSLPPRPVRLISVTLTVSFTKTGNATHTHRYNIYIYIINMLYIIYIYMCISYHVSIRASCDALHSEAMKPHNWELTHCTWRPAGNTSLSPHQALFYLGIGPFRVQVWIVLILLWNGNIRVTSKGSTPSP